MNQLLTAEPCTQYFVNSYQLCGG